MKKYLLIALLLISFLWINVKADEESEEIITTDPEVAVIEEEKKEEPTRVEMKAEPTRGDAKADGEEPSVAKVTVNIVDTRNNSVVKSFSSLATDSSMAALKIKEVFPNINNSFKDVLNGKTYTFKGFYTKA